MTNTPLTVIDGNGTSITVLSDDYGLGFGNAAGTSTQLVGIDSSDTVTFASAISALPAGDFLFVTSAIKQDRFEIGQSIAINKDLFRKCFANTSGSTIAFKRIYGSLKVTESKANIDTQLVDSSGGSGTFVTLSGDVVSQVTGGATTIQTGVVTNAKLASVPTLTIKGKDTTGTGAPKDLTVTEVKTMLAINNVDNTSDANKPVSTATQAALNELQGDVDTINTNVTALVTLSGVAAGSTNLGTFTGTTIADNLTEKAALQSLETALELLPKGAESGTHVDPTTKKVRLGSVLLEDALVDGNSLFGFNATNLKTASLVTDATGTAQSSLVLGKLISQPTRLKTASVATPTTMSELVVDADGNSQFYQYNATDAAGVQLSSPTEAKIKNNTYSIGVKVDGIYAETLGAKTTETEVVYVDSTTGKLAKGVLGSGIAGITVQEENVTLGTTGTVDTISFVGTGTTATRTGNTVTVTSTASSSKYALSGVTGSAGITCRVKGTPGITLAKITASIFTFTIPAGGYMDNHEVFFPAGENPNATVTFVYNYTSNTITNQGTSTLDSPTYTGWFSSTPPIDIYHSRAIGSASDIYQQVIAVGSGNLTTQLELNSTGLNSGDIVIKANF